MPQIALDTLLDMDQKKILYIYSLYSNAEALKYLQYTAMLAVSYYLMKAGVFPNYKDQLLVYDYRNDRRYMWEDKKFMADINILRDQKTLLRARARSKEYRDVNAHQISTIGLKFLNEIKFATSPEGKQIAQLLKCRCGRLPQITLENDCPYLICNKCGLSRAIEGFLYNLHENIKVLYKPFFLE